MSGLFMDANFPPYNHNPKDDNSIDIWGKVVRNNLLNSCNLNKVQWVRPAEILAQRNLDPTFEDACVLGTELYAEDSRQAGSGLGNCWLMSTMACMAEQAPELIRACFSDEQGTVPNGKVALAETGRYDVHLWDLDKRKATLVVIDDRLPCLKDPKDPKGNFNPMFSDCRSAVWALLLVKAFAKLWGSYSKLDNKVALRALVAIAGEASLADQIYLKEEDQDAWQRKSLSSVTAGNTSSQGSTSAAQASGQGVPVTGVEPYSTARMFDVLRDRWNVGNEHLVIALAYKQPLVDTEANHAKGAKHAFTVVTVHSSTAQPGLVLLQLHNPWGKEERWTGRWSDSSDDWNVHTQVALEVNWYLQRRSDKGFFWMDLEDFKAHFDCLHTVRLKNPHRVDGVFPGGMPKWAKDFWTQHFLNSGSVLWSDFKKACEAQTNHDRPKWDEVVRKQAQQHGSRPDATFMEDVLKVALVSGRDDAVTPAALYLLLVTTSQLVYKTYSKTYVPPQCMADALQQLLDSSDLSGLFQAQLKQELKQLRTALRVPAEAGVQSSTCAALRGQALDPRAWLLEHYDDWLTKEGSSRLLLLLAPTFSGKSVFAATLAHERRDSVQAIHFCSPGQDGSAKAIICSIAVQLARRLQALRSNLLDQLGSGQLSVANIDAATADELFNRLLRDPLGAVQQDAPHHVIVVIDGLNASNRNDHGCPEVLSMLDKFHALPTWLRVVATSRPEPYVLPGTHQARICAPNLSCLNPIYIRADDSHHLDDLATYIGRILKDRGSPGGNFLATATADLVQHNVPRFWLTGYKDLKLPSKTDLAAARAEDVLQYLTGHPDHRHDLEFCMWPEEQYGQLLDALRLRAENQASSNRPRWDEHALLLHGMFGLGKTTLAKHIRAVAEGIGRKVVWVSCGEVADTDACYDAIRREFDETKSLSVVSSLLESLIRNLLCRHYNMMIILDDVWERNACAAQSVIQQALDVGGAVQVLITSRFRLDQLTGCQRILLDSGSMTKPGINGHSLAGTVLLERTLSGLPDCASGVAYYEKYLKDHAGWPNVIQHILDSCDGCMLAVVMIAAHLKNSGGVGEGPELTQWQTVANGLQRLIASKPAPANLADDENGRKQRRTIFSAASMSIKALQEHGTGTLQEQVACLQAMSLFPSGAMVQLPYCFPVYCALLDDQALNLTAAQKALCAALETLCSHSLVFKDRTGYRMHDIMAEFLQSDNDHRTKVDMKQRFGDQRSANSPSAGLSAVAVVAMCGRQQCRSDALGALSISEKQSKYLAAVAAAGYTNSPQQLLLPPDSCMAYERSIDACCKCFLTALALGKPLALVQAGMKLVEVAAGQTVEQHVMHRLERACKGVLRESLVDCPVGDWKLDGDAAVVLGQQNAILKAIRSAPPDKLKLYLVLLRTYVEVTAGAGEMAVNLAANAVEWVQDCITDARESLLPWRRAHPHAEVNDMFWLLWELSFTPLLDFVSMDSYTDMVDLLVDAMRTFPLDDDGWAAQGDPNTPGSPVTGDPGWTMLQAEGLLAQLLRVIVNSKGMHPFMPKIFDKVMEAVPYLASMMNDEGMHQLRCPQVILWLAWSTRHARVLAQNAMLLQALHSVKARGELMGEGEYKKIIMSTVPTALSLIERAAGGADASAGKAAAGIGKAVCVVVVECDTPALQRACDMRQRSVADCCCCCCC